MSRPRTGGSLLVRVEGTRELRPTLPSPTRVDVHPVQGDLPSLQVTDQEAPPARLDGDPVDHEERRASAGWVEHDRSQHEPEPGIDAHCALEAGAREPGGQCRDGPFAEGTLGGGGAEQRQEANIKADAQEEGRAEPKPPPGAHPGTRRWQRPTASIGK